MYNLLWKKFSIIASSYKCWIYGHKQIKLASSKREISLL